MLQHVLHMYITIALYGGTYFHRLEKQDGAVNCDSPSRYFETSTDEIFHTLKNVT